MSGIIILLTISSYQLFDLGDGNYWMRVSDKPTALFRVATLTYLAYRIISICHL